jgi:hypothetical protein
MTMKTNTRLVLVLGTILGLCAVSYFVGIVRAGGAPTITPLVYSGTLLDASGSPVSASHSIGISLWRDPSSTAPAMRVCSVNAATVTPAHGRFSIVLDPACTTAAHTTPDLWVEIGLDGNALPRTHLGAVPYSLETARVTRSGPTGDVTAAATVCGFSTNATNGMFTSGAATGFAAARAICQATCASPSAHICSGEEMSVSVQAGIAAAPLGNVAWVFSPRALDTDVATPSIVVDSCRGFTNATHAIGGAAWDFGLIPGNPVPSWDYCDRTHLVACCD